MNVYDFDGTIYDGESSVEFILAYLKKDIRVLQFVPSLLVAAFKYKLGRITFEDFKIKYSAKVEHYFKTCKPDIESIVEPFWDKHFKQIKPFYKEIQKEDDVLLTASPEFMMHDICNRLGIKNLIATDFNPKTGEVHMACFREKKIPCFFERYPNGEIDDFYTDSMNDKFMFPYAKRVFLVKGKKITRIK